MTRENRAKRGRWLQWAADAAVLSVEFIQKIQWDNRRARRAANIVDYVLIHIDLILEWQSGIVLYRWLCHITNLPSIATQLRFDEN